MIELLSDRGLRGPRLSALLCLTTLLIWGCHDTEDSETDTDAPSMSSAGAMVAGEGSGGGEGGNEGGGEGGDEAGEMPMIEVLPDPKASAPPSEWSPFTSIQWWVTSPRDDDELFADLERGVVQALDEENRAYDKVWTSTISGEDGQIIPEGGARSFYAMTTLTVENTLHVVARLDSVAELAINGRRLPGDFYSSGKMRLPITLNPGENRILIRTAARGVPTVQLSSTSWPVAFNLNDLTPPDLRVGDTSAALFLGVPILNFLDHPLTEVGAWVMESPDFEVTRLTTASIPAHSLTQVGFSLKPKRPFEEAERVVPVTLHLEAAELDLAYDLTLELTVRPSDAHYRKTFRSPIDGSIQYYGVRAPSDFDLDQEYALVMSLHGASVEAINQASSYAPKPWAVIIAPTNRRPFGFDWEEWGHFNAMAALDDARSTFNIDPTRVYLTGHSMGGHGTWHVGALHPGEFATLGPSAGWQSFYTYGGGERPGAPIAWARAHSDTALFLNNLSNRGIYIIHGDQDESVPVSEGRTMFDLLSQVSEDVTYHEEEGAIHWWDTGVGDGVDCVDWPPLFDFMQARTLDPLELNFEFTSPSPAYSAKHSYLTLESAADLSDLLVARSNVDAEGTLTLTTQNVRSMSIDARALREHGVNALTINETPYPLDEETLWVGPTEGKQREVYGAFNQVYRRPFCWIYPDEDVAARNFTSYLSAYWTLIGNGHACALPLSKQQLARDEGRNLIYVKVPASQLNLPSFISWEGSTNALDGQEFIVTAMALIYPDPARDGEQLLGVLNTGENMEYLLYRLNPFSSRSGLPDFIVWGAQGAKKLGFFDMDWSWNPGLVAP
jgi:hypothetical protein